MACGDELSYGLTENGLLFKWGQQANVPELINSGEKKYVAIASSNSQGLCAAIDEDNYLWAWQG